MNWIVPLMIAGSVWAAESGKKIDVIDPAWGKFVIKVEKAAKPVQNPIRMDVSVLCKDQRTKPTSVTPKEEELLDHDSICAFDKYTFDKEQKILTVAFTVSKTEDEVALCKDHQKQEFDLKKLCAPWTSVAK